MTTFNRQNHWERVYTAKAENEVSWFEESPTVSLELIKAVGATPPSAIIDIGGGASRLADRLVREGHAVTVLDVSSAALAKARNRLGSAADKVTWIATDITTWKPN